MDLQPEISYVIRPNFTTNQDITDRLTRLVRVIEVTVEPNGKTLVHIEELTNGPHNRIKKGLLWKKGDRTSRTLEKWDFLDRFDK